MLIEPTPSQTAGPFLHLGLIWPDGPDAVPPGTPDSFVVFGHIYDGARQPVTDALVETWQVSTEFRGFGRCPTDESGRFWVRTVKPDPPHLDISIFARGLLDRVVTRLYFADEPQANAADPVLSTVDPSRRPTLIAQRAEGGYRLDIRLQGPDETVFFHA